MTYKYDVFLSHNSKDKPAVEIIARVLKEKYGLRCWLDKANLVPGELPGIHPLLAAYARTLALPSKDLLENLADKLARLARQANDQMDRTGSLGWFLPLRSHVFSVGQFSEQADIQMAASLLGNLGYYLLRIADYKGAKVAYERALQIAEATWLALKPPSSALCRSTGRPTVQTIPRWQETSTTWGGAARPR